ncbi:MAG: hypothetical protein HGA23_06665 [Bacteroidales bacterium]|nr:hypothetical protein [Bacteroidales bacterium]
MSGITARSVCRAGGKYWYGTTSYFASGADGVLTIPEVFGGEDVLYEGTRLLRFYFGNDSLDVDNLELDLDISWLNKTNEVIDLGDVTVDTASGGGTIQIGSNYQGGIIFYLEPGGLHGLIAAPFDQAHAPWGCYGTDIEGTASEIGTGQANTTHIVNMCGEGTAASICNDLELNGYNDWFLPSYLELKEMYKQVDVIGGFENMLYWCSTEYGKYWAISVQMNTGEGNDNQPKFNDAIRVRAIRAF